MLYKEKKKAVTDNHQIDLKKTLDVHYWSTVLKTTPNELKKAVKQNGNSVAVVKKVLRPGEQGDSEHFT